MPTDIAEVLKRNGLNNADVHSADCGGGMSVVITKALEVVAELLDALDAEMSPACDPEWGDPSCNTNFHDARAILAEILR